MKLKNLIEGLECKLIQGSDDIEISNLEMDSRKVKKDSLFVCISGAEFDGHEYAKSAIDAGAKAIICEKELDINDKDITVIRVEDTRFALAKLSSVYFGKPSEKLKIIGITGTKGKTTTTYMIKSILENSGKKVGLIGTIEIDTGSENIESKNTTPESYDIHKYFSEMVKNNIEYCVMEVSSQALMLHRTAGIEFEIGVFTNLGKDHIGGNEHKDFEDYRRCKSLLFKQSKIGIANIDDDNYKYMFENSSCKELTFALNNDADFTAKNIEYKSENEFLGMTFNLLYKKDNSDNKMAVSIPGRFNVYNALAAISVTKTLGVDFNTINETLKTIKVSGRLENVHISNKFNFIVDYAHNAMSLESLLKNLREGNPKRIISIFGCGGNRSKERRYNMGEVSGKLADFTIITSDNPRFEEPMDIIDDILIGMHKTNGKYIVIPDRKEAIRYSIENAKEGDLIALTGKGHEAYQEIKGVKYEMDERKLVKEVADELKNKI